MKKIYKDGKYALVDITTEELAHIQTLYLFLGSSVRNLKDKEEISLKLGKLQDRDVELALEIEQSLIKNKTNFE